jgi:sensor c-di-GMP phosphodiesterase-like protein
VPIIEQLGKVEQLTDFLLTRVLRDLPEIRGAGVDARISINLSPMQLCSASFKPGRIAGDRRIASSLLG